MFAAQPPALFLKHKAFFAPLLAKIEGPSSDCVLEARFDMAGYLTSLANDARSVRYFSTLGAAEIKKVTLCVQDKRAVISMEGRVSGVLGSLHNATLDLSGLAGDHYWLTRASLQWPVSWEALSQVDRRFGALLVAAGAILDADAAPLLVRPLTGRFAAGELADGKHFVEADATDTAGFARLARTLDAQVPHREFGRKRRANEWGFFGGVTGFSGEGEFFVQLEPQQVRITDAVSALDRKRTYKALPMTAAAIGTFDVQRLRKLMERVGHADDTRVFFRTSHLGSLVDVKAAPVPAALLTVDRLTWSLSQTGDRLSAVLTFAP